MYLTNFTTVKPTVSTVHQTTSTTLSIPTFGSGRDIAYLVFSILTFLVTVFGLVWVNHIIRKKDRKEEDKRLRKEELDREKERNDQRERFEKEGRDKIADIIDKEYNNIVDEDIAEKLRKCKEKLKAMVMFNGAYKITGLDILKYKLLKSQQSSESIIKLQKNLDAVLKLFQSLRIKLPLEGECPINIKEEFGPLITDLGKITRLFVSSKKRYTISNVLKYFGSVEQVESRSVEEEKDNDFFMKVEQSFPYIEFLKLPYHYDEFSFYICCRTSLKPEVITIFSELRDIEFELSKGSTNITTDKQDKLREFAIRIAAIMRRKFADVLPMPDWSKEELSDIHANVLHALRVFIFEVNTESDIIDDEEFNTLVTEMRKIAYVDSNAEFMHKCISTRAIDDMKEYLASLEKIHSHLCVRQSISDRLGQMRDNLCKTISDELKS